MRSFLDAPFHGTLLFCLYITGKMIKICGETDVGLQSYQKFRDFYDAKLSEDMITCAMFEIFTGLPDVDDADNSMEEAYIILKDKNQNQNYHNSLRRDNTDSRNRRICWYVFRSFFDGYWSIVLLIFYSNGKQSFQIDAKKMNHL